MTHDRCRATALVERAARVREGQAEQHLAEALARERKQQEITEASAARLRDTEQGLRVLHAGDQLDLSRVRLYGDLAYAQQVTLEDDQANLQAEENIRAVRMSELADKSHYRDGASKRARDAHHEYRQSRDRRETERLIESWILRAIWGKEHE